MTRPIGGFLPLHLPFGAPPAQSVLTHWIGDAKHVWLLHNARSALHQLWRAIGPRRIWLPSYVCADVAKAVPPGVEARFYPLDEALEPRTDALAAQLGAGDHVLAVDYFGRPPGASFRALAHSRPDVGWVEDRAHALDPGEAPWGNWLLYSPRKLLGVPDGGILVARDAPLPVCSPTPATDLSFVMPTLERFEDAKELDHKRWYADYLREEAAMGVESQAISRLTVELLKATGLRAAVESRKRNYAILHRRLRRWAFLAEADPAFAPLGFPIRVRSAEIVSARLAERRVFAARHWSSLPSDASTFGDEHRLSRELVTLPCDYRYGEEEMNQVADAALDVIDPEA